MFNFRFGWGARRSGSEPEAFSQSLFIDHTPKINEVYIFTLLMVLLIQFFDFFITLDTRWSRSGPEALEACKCLHFNIAHDKHRRINLSMCTNNSIQTLSIYYCIFKTKVFSARRPTFLNEK